MTTAVPAPHGVHLVGSVPLATTQDVFRTVSAALGSRLRRIPDGETGERYNWIVFQFDRFAHNPQFEVIPPAPGEYPGLPRARLRDPAGAEQLDLGPLGYTKAALESYATFRELRDAGEIPADCRFLVCLPTPLAPVNVFIVPEQHDLFEPIYERHLLAELDQIAAAIPHQDLAIQWDVAVEFALLEQVWGSHLTDTASDILSRLVRVGERVPPEVDLGYHLCYGDAGHQHFIQPKDMGHLVRVANALRESVGRTINFIHMPVPVARTDDAYFAPLRDLRLDPQTELYLGIVGYTDGEAEARARVAAAQRAYESFGIATECGMGRCPPEQLAELLRIHAAIATG